MKKCHNSRTDPFTSGQSVADAQQQYDVFMLVNRKLAMNESDLARTVHSCRDLRKALVLFGEAYHSFSDSLSPAHKGFQPWWWPIDGLLAMGPAGYLDFVEDHESKETEAVYRANQSAVVDAVNGEFANDLSYLLKQ